MKFISLVINAIVMQNEKTSKPHIHATAKVSSMGKVDFPERRMYNNISTISCVRVGVCICMCICM